jgi:ADP-ribose pyrophosphatase YjhB (NUDIX family)
MTVVHRRYPDQPIFGVGAVIVTDAGQVVLVRRSAPPLVGRWTLPGGVVELGESARAAVAREVLEETGLVVDVGSMVEVVDFVSVEAGGRVEYHFVIADYLCRPRSGSPVAGGDAAAVMLAPRAELAHVDLTADTMRVIHLGLDMYTARGGLA